MGGSAGVDPPLSRRTCGGDDIDGHADPVPLRVRVLIVENHELVSDALSAMLADHPDMHVVGTAASVAEAIARLSACRPEVVLIDYHLGDGTGIEVAQAVRALNPSIRSIFVSRSDGDAIRLRALEAGAIGFIHKSKAAAEIVAAIRAVAGGQSLFTPAELASLLSLRRRMSTFDGLTNREVEVLQQIRAGKSNRQIAERLGIAYATVRVHLRAIEYKLGAHNKLEALARARELGVLD